MLFSRKRKRPDEVTLKAPAGSFVIPLDTGMPVLVSKYINAMETGESDDWCRCEWVIHPDDAKVKKGTCRDCGEIRNHNVHQVMETIGFHAYKGKRMRRLDDAPDCPVHTKEGFLLYFFQWVIDYARD